MFNAKTKSIKSPIKSLAHYLGELKPKAAQKPAEMLAILREIKGRGAPMNIRKLN